MEFPVILHIPEFRPLAITPKEIARSLVNNMSGVVESGIVDSEDDFKVNLSTIQVNGVTLTSDPTADRQQTLQNKSGVIALLDDAYGIGDTVILPEGLVSVDWDMGKRFLVTLSGNRQSAFYMFHSKPGMEIDLLLVNQGTNQTVGAWDAAIKWPAGTPPSMPPALSGASALMKVNLVNVNGVIYGESLNYSVTGGGAELGS